ncbi:MAG: iron complex outerrane recepter protein [Sphingomonadales bacterium]|nr:iron complex outerrane recepter protein [Sphingomonadales bacterium]
MLRLGGASLALAMVLAASPASAQPSTTTPDEPLDSASTAAAQNDETIVVTGSRIRRNPLDQDQPVTFLDEADIARTGLTSAADVLQRLPSSGGALNSRFNNSGNFGNPPDGGGVGAGAAEVDLRYLGSKRVLVLVDGIRYVNGASASGVPGATDLNSIPESMIERIEVLQDGASAIYGSDAIAGVVNIITRKKQDGLRLSAQLGVMNEGDGFTRNLQASYGLQANDGATSLVVGGNWVKQDGISSADRQISLFPAPGATSCLAGGCSSGTPLGRFIINSGPPPGRTLIAPVIGRAPTLADYRTYAGAADAFNFAPYNFIQTPLERYGVFANARQELGEVAALSLKAVWNRRNSKNQAAPLPLFVGPDSGNGNLLDRITIDATNPFNPFGRLASGRTLLTDLPNGEAANYAFIGRRVVEGGPRRYSQQVDTLYLTGTLDGKFQVGGHDWYWDVNAAYGRNKAKQTVLGNINAANLALALGPVAACTAPCVPFNIFGGAGSITQAQLDFVSFEQNDTSLQTQWDYTANLSGELFDLPGGAAGFAIGVEHRKQNGRFDPDPVVAQGLGSDIPALPTRGGYNVDEIYAELRLPLLRDRPFFNRLELTGAARYSDYSESGSTTTFKAGADWKPIEDLLLRGSWSEGFRAPSIGELFGTPSRFDQEIVDPCSAVGGAIPAAVRTNCIAAGVPAGGTYVQANPQLPVITGGNLALGPETSENWGAGAVWSPSFIPRLSLEANYFNIKVDGAIQAIDAEVLLGRCTQNADALSCAAITRSASGAVTQIRGLLQNIAGIRTDGLDVTLNYRTGETGLGRFGLYWTNTFLFNYRIAVPATDGVTVIGLEGTERGSPDQAFPKWKSTAVLDWAMKDGFGASLTGRYIKGVDEANGNHLDSRLYADLQLRWEPENWNGFGFALGANNLFNSDPPPCISCGLNNLDPTTYDVPGTFFYAKVSFKM